MSNDILVVVEYKDGGVRKVSLELLSRAKEMISESSSTLYAGVIGHDVKGIVETVRPFADKVISVDGAVLKDYRWDTYVSVAEQLVRKYNPSMIFGGSTVTGKDLFPRLAARLKTTIISDAVGIEWNHGGPRIKKPLYGGKIVSWLTCKEGVVPVVTFRPNSFAIMNRSLKGEVIEESPDIVPDSRFSTLSIDKGGAQKVDLQEADFIICGGRGMKGPENFRILEEIADIMEGRVAASRAVVDSKWRGYDDQVGKSGKTVSPKLYIGCGVSGALHHTMGMDTSKVIVAVNTDPNAPIFSYADYGIVGDLFDILPVLKDELTRTKKEI
ncbi:electron transfer flavoprotein subunit alpha/FixB family protein [Syntrophorhabdus aromaticivorans]|uniref:Electron transfer flavoprotein subunit alpha/FixB family protein n=1 Tax=Syntrophorhabdus aromaticivorans TaxID=328301 RepID=A0A971M175_9BACT|nr:electron transfer flavoprotein subunit alpha/FixB family protein [Syntrophorhabdus aromaticivorans]NLW34227.1 electron transfer flavoprotein subunit alpha/FixB family protein [Syntrophorhabdus aromaticivorans]